MATYHSFPSQIKIYVLKENGGGGAWGGLNEIGSCVERFSFNIIYFIK
ncbi:hypothetical protein D3OALGB2SA_2601 [Olavius algarvensis associated proteobacterium Delta 3]|nr:hypothetical protein D3OALGB2SA_2601 [Olavius algarvensis associated proteobacterium Delta 3]